MDEGPCRNSRFSLNVVIAMDGYGDFESAVLRVAGVSRSFGPKLVLDGIDLEVPAGTIHAVLGPNGAGKTTLLRIIAGTADPSAGVVTVAGDSARPGKDREQRRRIGLVPAQSQSFYMRLSGYENLLFFGRLQGLGKKRAVRRAHESLAEVGLADAADMRAGLYSTGMLRRLTIARAVLVEPPVLLVDEATMGLDPEGARSVRDMFVDIARRGAAIVWTTQRIDEIRAFADRVTLIHEGRVRFAGSVPELIALATPRHYVVQLSNGSSRSQEILEMGRRAVVRFGELTAARGGGDGHFLLALDPDTVLGDALNELTAAGCGVISVREDRSGIEEAFLALIDRASHER